MNQYHLSVALLLFRLLKQLRSVHVQYPGQESGETPTLVYSIVPKNLGRHHHARRRATVVMTMIRLLSTIATLLCMPPLTVGSLVLFNGTIYTVDESNPWAEAVIIDDNGMLSAVGTNDEITSKMNENTTTMIDLQQRLLLPGFQDAHLHAVEAGINAQLCYIDEDAFVQDIPFYFDDCENGGLAFGGQWIVGAGIDVGILLEEQGLEEDPIVVLDRAYPDTPVLILDSLGHGAVANSQAMAAVGYDVLTGNPPGGILVRNEETNELTGIVLENAQQQLRDAAFPPTEANQNVAYNSQKFTIMHYLLPITHYLQSRELVTHRRSFSSPHPYHITTINPTC